jgi:hypothetical protein
VEDGPSNPLRTLALPIYEFRSLARAGAVTPLADTRLDLSALNLDPEGPWCPPVPPNSLKLALSAPPPGTTVPDSTLSGNDSRLFPNILAGASALIEAFVSTEFRRRRFEEDARVKMDASSVSTLFAVAVW